MASLYIYFKYGKEKEKDGHDAEEIYKEIEEIRNEVNHVSKNLTELTFKQVSWNHDNEMTHRDMINTLRNIEKLMQQILTNHIKS